MPYPGHRLAEEPCGFHESKFGRSCEKLSLKRVPAYAHVSGRDKTLLDSYKMGSAEKNDTDTESRFSENIKNRRGENLHHIFVTSVKKLNAKL